MPKHQLSSEPARSSYAQNDAKLARVMVSDILQLVECESPSDDLQAVARSAETVATLAVKLLGTEPERIVIDGCTHLRWRFGRTPRVLLVGHHDTVWPIGTLRTHPGVVEQGVLRGPGCFDMAST